MKQYSIRSGLTTEHVRADALELEHDRLLLPRLVMENHLNQRLCWILHRRRLARHLARDAPPRRQGIRPLSHQQAHQVAGQQGFPQIHGR